MARQNRLDRLAKPIRKRETAKTLLYFTLLYFTLLYFTSPDSCVWKRPKRNVTYYPIGKPHDNPGRRTPLGPSPSSRSVVCASVPTESYERHAVPATRAHAHQDPTTPPNLLSAAIQPPLAAHPPTLPRPAVRSLASPPQPAPTVPLYPLRPKHRGISYNGCIFWIYRPAPHAALPTAVDESGFSCAGCVVVCSLFSSSL